MTKETYEDDVYIEAAARKWGNPEALLIQTHSAEGPEEVVDRVKGGGAWVLAWVWITEEEAKEVHDGGG